MVERNKASVPGNSVRPGVTRRLLLLLGEFVGLTALMVGAAAVVRFDVVHLGNILTERSVTQIAQALCVLLASVIFAVGAVREPGKRGYLTVLAAIFLAMFIRENDGPLDAVFHGFWVIPVVIVLIACLWIVLRNRTSLTTPLLAHAETRSFSYMLAGVVIVTVFSRMFGTGSFWREVMGPDYKAVHKMVPQEGVELLGYVLVAFGAVMYRRAGFGDGQGGKR